MFDRVSGCLSDPRLHGPQAWHLATCSLCATRSVLCPTMSLLLPLLLSDNNVAFASADLLERPAPPDCASHSSRRQRRRYARGTRALIGASTREALRAQMSEEQLRASVAARPPEPETASSTGDIVDMTPATVRQTYGDHHLPGTQRPEWWRTISQAAVVNDDLPPAPPGVERWPRIRPQRLQVSDLISWMESSNITREGLAEACNGSYDDPTGNPGAWMPEIEAPSPGRLRRSDQSA